jgi:hypothetical protein
MKQKIFFLSKRERAIIKKIGRLLKKMRLAGGDTYAMVNNKNTFIKNNSHKKI